MGAQSFSSDASSLFCVSMLGCWRERTGFTSLQFTKYNASGGTVWAAAFGIAGYALGQNMLLFAGPLGWLALAATATVAYLLWSFYKTHEGRLLL
jgi:membrane protein DedA with SNARE-associated domain